MACRAPRASRRQPRGKAVYDAHCVECHGADRQRRRRLGGVSAVPRPRDFTTGKYKIRSTETGTLPTDDDLIGSVRQRALRHRDAGLGSHPVATRDIRDVVSYIKSLSPRFASEAAEAGRRSATAAAELAGQHRARRSRSTRSCSAASATAPTAAAPARSPPTFEDDWRHAAARGRPHRAVDVPRRRDVARHLPALPHRHDRHADAVVRRRRERRRDVGPRQLRRLARAQAGVVDDRRRSRSSSTRSRRREAKANPVQARRASRRHARLRDVPLAGRRATSACCRA